MNNPGVYGNTNNFINDNEMVCLSLNMNSLRKDSQKEKNDSLCNFVTQSSAELVAMQEVNLNWDKLPERE